MNVPLERGLVLYRQARYADAEREFLGALALDPANAKARGLIALCACCRRELTRALEEARAALLDSPGDPFLHYVLAIVEHDFENFPRARDVAREAIRLDPLNADFFALLALIEIRLKNWNLATEAAEKGLQIDPRHVRCLDRRGQALMRSRRLIEATASLRAAIAVEPEDALAHSNLGTALLQQIEPGEAAEHFLEALRLSPHHQPAREGYVESLKARHWLYRFVLSAIFRLRDSSPWAVAAIAATATALLALLLVSQGYEWLGVIVPLFFASFIFLLILGSLGNQVAIVIVRFHPLGRHVILNRQRAKSNTVIAFVIAAVATVIAGKLSHNPIATGIVFGICLFGVPMGAYWPLRDDHRGGRLRSRTIKAALVGSMALALVAGMPSELCAVFSFDLFIIYVLICLSVPGII